MPDTKKKIDGPVLPKLYTAIYAGDVMTLAAASGFKKWSIGGVRCSVVPDMAKASSDSQILLGGTRPFPCF